ncbi:PAS domain S-box protein (plasmid) [Deinococcus taeanensis]|uniref:PAS domain S-box protein n=1 Tax=Deinococcus taeanensis TaxID=2737050 RepID=UPI001CDB71B4|nr:PAS domain S-box protein [Deinococcus taeanensis]UBV44910.1 PAS domain S-box protein [Deinococcus taeanensis]
MTQPDFTPALNAAASTASETLFRTLLNHSADIVALVDSQGFILYHNPAARQHLGEVLTPAGQAPCPLSMWDAIHPDDAPNVRRLAFELLPAGVTITLPPSRVRHANGSWRWLEGSAINLCHDERVRGVLIRAADVTARVEHTQHAQTVMQLAESLLTTRSLGDVLQVLLHEALPALGASAGGVALITNGGQDLEVKGSVGYRPHVGHAWRRVPLSAPLPMTDALREGRAVFLTQSDLDQQYPHLRHALPPGMGSTAALPMTGPSGPLGVLVVNTASGEAFSAARQQAMQRVASLCAHALEGTFGAAGREEPDLADRFLTRYASEITTVLAPDGTILFDTDIATRLLGYPLNELIGRQILELIHPDDQGTVAQAMQQALQNRESTVTVTYRFLHRDGRWVWLASTGADHTHDPQVRGLLVNSRDVTAQREAELALERQQDAFLQLFEDNPLPMWVYDVETLAFMEVNDAALRRYGYDRAAFLRMKVTDIRPPEDVPAALPVLRAATTNPHGTPSRHLTRDGQRLDVIARAHLLTLAGRAAKLVVIEDITERRAAERDLAASERKFRLLAENASNVIATFTPGGQCTYLSPACQALLGISPDMYQSVDPFAFVYPEDQEQLRHMLTQAQAPGFTETTMTYRVRRADQEVRWVETTFKAVRSPLSGQILEFQTATMDIHARKAAEEQLQTQLERTQHLVDLTVALEGHHEPRDVAREALERCLRVTEYTCGCYVDVQRGTLTLLHASGCSKDLLDALRQTYPTLNLLGEAGDGMPRGESIHHLIDHQRLPDALQVELLPYRSACAMPVMAQGELAGAFLLLSPTAEVTTGSRRLLRAVAERVSAALERSQHLQQLDASREETLRALGLALEYRDYETKGHTDRVTHLSEQLGRALGFQGADLDALRWGAYLHDTGKVAIPDAVLLKPGSLNADEWSLMTRHAEIGHEMLCHIPNLPQTTLTLVRHHHEKWNGTGYPAGLAGPAIPLAARVFSVVDVFDALTSDRPYRPAWTVDRARAYLLANAGEHFDPEVVQAFLALPLCPPDAPETPT